AATMSKFFAHPLRASGQRQTLNIIQTHNAHLANASVGLPIHKAKQPQVIEIAYKSHRQC
ncbi:hypothetical protein VV97_19115, partial [Vibrio vulnificus]